LSFTLTSTYFRVKLRVYISEFYTFGTGTRIYVS